MATKIIKTEFQFKRGLSEAWAQKNAILRIGDSLGVTLVESDVITRKVYYKLDEKVLIKKI